MSSKEEEDLPDKELYIPVPIPDSDDYISGIAQQEVILISFGTVAAIIVGIIFTVIFNTITGVSIGASIVAGTITFIRRDIYNENLIKKIRIFTNFRKAQKKFIYVFQNEFNSDCIEDDDE